MKVYVGTYGKYNAGSIDGAWIDLDKFNSYDEFLAACRKLHHDEHDPEFMIQDTETDGEDWQAGFTGELTSGYSDYWKIKAEVQANGGELVQPIGQVTRNEAKNGVEIRFFERPAAEVLADLKAHGWRWSRFAGCWYNRYSEDTAAYAQRVAGAASVAAGVSTDQTPRRSSFIRKLEEEAKASLVEYRAWLEADPKRVARLWKRDVSGHIRDLVAAVKLDSGEWITFDKPSITTEHCEGEDDGRGRSMADAQAGCRWFETEVGFKTSNNIKSKFNGPHGKTWGYGHDDWHRETWSVYARDGHAMLERKESGYYCQHEPDYCREVSPREWSAIRRADAWRAISKRRRVNAYWRRFGNSKLRTWTYWTEA